LIGPLSPIEIGLTGFSTGFEVGSLAIFTTYSEFRYSSYTQATLEGGLVTYFELARILPNIFLSQRFFLRVLRLLPWAFGRLHHHQLLHNVDL